MKNFEMPENYDCKCVKGMSYNKESEVCQKCVKSTKVLDLLFDKLLEKGNPDMIATFIVSAIAAKIEREKNKKEEDFKNER